VSSATSTVFLGAPAPCIIVNPVPGRVARHWPQVANLATTRPPLDASEPQTQIVSVMGLDRLMNRTRRPEVRPSLANPPAGALPARAGSRYNPDSVLRSLGHGRRAVPARHGPAAAAGVFHMATCPECDAELDIDEFDVDKGDVISCPECGSNLEVTGLAPLEIEVIEEDDDEDDDLEEAEEEEGDEDEDEDEEEDRWEE